MTFEHTFTGGYSLACCACTGQEFCVELRKTVPDAVVPVIMISAKTDEENIVNGLQHGCNDFIWWVFLPAYRPSACVAEFCGTHQVCTP